MLSFILDNRSNTLHFSMSFIKIQPPTTYYLASVFYKKTKAITFITKTFFNETVLLLQYRTKF